MTSQESRLEQLLEKHEISLIETSRLRPTLNACWHKPSRTIYLRKGIDPTTRRCAIAHEIGHALHEDDCSSPRAERDADKFAAKTLISATEVEILACELDGSPAALAAALGVTPHLLGVWGDMYSRGEINTCADQLAS